ncbi:MAG TPA: hypothetical protein DCM71_21890 [Runella sp.]|nr:hypothetical protein [Runella sp.]
MNRPFSNNFKKGFLIALYEYLIITLPIGLYVFIEASHKSNWHFLYSTPEWSIATIFLSFISLSKFVADLGKDGRKFDGPILGIFGLFNLIIIVSAAMNANMSLEKESITLIIFRIFIFSISTIVFFVLVTGIRLIKK